MAQTAVVIMAKAPQAGTVKTRLCPPLSPQTAASLYRAFLLDKIAQVGELAHAQATLAYTPAESRAVFAELAPHCLLIPQQGAELGERLHNSFARCFAAGYTSVLAIDSDTPNLPTAYLQQAVDLIAAPQTDMVIGPTEDGGYYLIGMRQFHGRLFEAIDWSTERVFRQTIARAGEIGLPVAALAEWYDVDDEASLIRLARELFCSPKAAGSQSGGYAAPRTTALFERLAATNSAVRQLLTDYGNS